MRVARVTLVAVLAIASIGAPSLAESSDGRKLPRIGYLGNSSEALERDLVAAFREGLKEHGWVEGKNVEIEYRWAEGKPERFPQLVVELLGARVAVIVAAGAPGIIAAKKATSTTPIVMAVAGNAVETGLVASLSKPGGNVTGMTTMIQDLEGKRLEMLKAGVPGISSVAVLLNPANPSIPKIFSQTREKAIGLGLQLHPFEVPNAAGLDAAFVEMARHRPGAVVVLADRTLLANRKRIVAFIAEQRLPAISAYSEFAEEGVLMSYGPNYADSFRRAAAYVDKILKGAKPADLPVEQPTKLELVINKKTATALGLTIPPELLVQADRVIE